MKVTTDLLMHLNFGSKGGITERTVFVDGVKTNIVLHQKTGGVEGKSKYTITEHYLTHGDDRLDLLEQRPPNADIEAWIVAHTGPVPVRHASYCALSQGYDLGSEANNCTCGAVVRA